MQILNKQPKICCFTFSPDSPRYVGAREFAGDFQHEAVGLQETFQQHLRGRRDTHHLLHHPAAQCLPLHHEPARHGAGPHQTGCQANVLPRWCNHPQQHHAAERYVLLQEGNANQVWGCFYEMRVKDCFYRQNWANSLSVCLGVTSVTWRNGWRRRSCKALML